MRVFVDKAIGIVTDIIEKYIPGLCFIVMFSTFIYGIIARRVFGSPVNWSYSLSCMLFTFFSLLAVSYASRRPDNHVVFGIVYDRMSVRGQQIAEAVGNLLILIPISFAFVPTIKSFLQVALVDSILGITYKYVYVSYVILLIETIIRYTARTVQMAKIILSGAPQSEVTK